MTTTNLGLTELTSGQQSPEVSVNEALAQLDQKLTETNTIALSDADTVLTNAQVQQYLALDFTGTLSAVRTLTLPGGGGSGFNWWLIRNSTSGGYRVLVKYATGNGCYIPAGANGWFLVYAGGTNVFNCGGYKHLTANLSWSTSDIDFSLNDFYKKAVTSNVTLTFSNILLGRTVWAEITVTSGSPTLTLPSEATIIHGTWDATSSAVNHLEFIPIDDTEGSQKVLVRIYQE